MADSSVFKGTIFEEVLNLTKRSSLQVILVSLLFLIITVVALGGIFIYLFLQMGVDLESLANIQQNPEVIQGLILQMAGVFQSPAFIALAILGVLLALIISAWQINLLLDLINQHVFQDRVDFGKTFKDSLNSGIWRVLLALIASYLVFGVLFAIVYVLADLLGGFAAFLGSLVLLIYLFRWTIMLPAYIIGNQSFSDAVVYSHRHITWIRALKLFGAAILFFIVLIALYAILALLGSGFSAINASLGVTVNYLLQTALNGVVTAFMYAVSIGLYYRYADVIGAENGDDPMDYLVTEDE